MVCVGGDNVGVRNNILSNSNDIMGVGNDIVSIRNIVVNIRDSRMDIDCKFGLNAKVKRASKKKVVQHTLNT